jgi:hypothetical protein
MAPIVGFEIVRGQVLVAHPKQLTVLAGQTNNVLDLKEAVKGVSVNHAGEVFIQTDAGFLTMRKDGFKLDNAISDAVHGRLYGSGNLVFLEVRAHQDILQFIARKPDGKAFPIASFKGRLRAASWNEMGLAAVVGDSLYVWRAGAQSIVRLLTDQGLNTAQDVVMVGPNRAVVSLPNGVVLVSNEGLSVVTGMMRSRCRFQQNTLYLLDGNTGIVWTFSGLDRLGTKSGDQSYAAELLRQAPKGSAEKSIQFREAARIIGCESATRHLARTSRAQMPSNPPPKH